MKNISSTKVASVAAGILNDKLASDIIILDISNVSVLADYFVIASADSSNQVKSLTNYVEDGIEKIFGKKPLKTETDRKNLWNLIDYGDVVVHILHHEQRDFYMLEQFWSKANKVSKEVWLKEFEPYSIYNQKD